MTQSDPVSSLPVRLRNRFQSLGNFVRAVIAEKELGIPKEDRLSPEQIRFIQLAVFIASLHFFLREGSKAAQAAVAGFESVGIPGFTVGSSEFVGQNDNVMRGEELAKKLEQLAGDMDLLDDELLRLTPTKLTLHLWNELQNGQ